MKNLSSNSIPKTLSESVYKNLRTGIINNELKAGQRIYEKEIANLYGVSTTPVREAFLKLNAEGYISIDSHRKASVKKISFKELEDIFMVMGDLDALAVSQAVDNFTPDCIQEIEELIAEMEEICQSSFVERFLELNVAIHYKIWSALPNKVMERTLHFVHGQLLRYNYARYVAFQDPDIMKRSLDEHKNILNALTNKNKREIKKFIKTHWSFLIQQLHVRNKFLTAFKGGEAAVGSKNFG
ncbi:MAG: GntR family transcriptional regulator [Candidatus Aminicenantaceae bacterium]